MDLRAVVPEELLLLRNRQGAKWCLEVTAAVLAADHESDLPGWVGWDGGVGVLDVREDLFAVFLELGDHWQVEPLVLS